MDLKPSTILISVLVVGMLISGSFLAANSITTNYNVTINNELSDITDDINALEFKNTSGTMKNKAAEDANKESDVSFFKSVWTGLGYVWGVFDTITAIINTIAEALSLPAWLVGSISAILLIMITFAIMSVIHRYPM